MIWLDWFRRRPNEIEELQREIAVRQLHGTNQAETDAYLKAQLESTHTSHIRELEKLRIQMRYTLAAAILAPVVGGILAIGGNLIDREAPPEPSTETISACVNAQLNVKRSLDLMAVRTEADLTDQRLTILGTVNPSEVDTECGDEASIARAVLPP